MKNSMTAYIRIQCGLGNQPEEYNQNSNESINSLIKKAKGMGELSVKETICLMHQEIKIQEEKLKLSLIGRGEWQLAEEYRSMFEISEQTFYKMTPEQRRR